MGRQWKTTHGRSLQMASGSGLVNPVTFRVRVGAYQGFLRTISIFDNP
jgi:hypothetical protein